jgi:hypothetical protein
LRLVISIRDFSNHASGIIGSQMNLDCLGSDNAERSYQRRLVALPIVPDYLREHRIVAFPQIVFLSAGTA